MTDRRILAACCRSLDAHVEVRGEDECWPWIGYTVKGYGRITVKVDNVETKQRAHRMAFERKHGYAPPVVRHSCDNPPCCNPKHLLPGTHQDNVADRVERGRSASGERNGRYKHGRRCKR